MCRGKITNVSSLISVVIYKLWKLVYNLTRDLHNTVHILLIIQKFQRTYSKVDEFKHNVMRPQTLTHCDEPNSQQCRCKHSVLVLAPKYKVNQEFAMESDFCANVLGSLEQFGCKVIQFWPSEILLKNSQETPNIKSQVSRIIEENYVEYIFVDLNISRKLEALSRDFFLSLKKQFDIKFVFLSWDWSVKKFEYWAEVADFYTSNHPSGFEKLKFLEPSKIIGIPGIIYPEERFPQGPKLLDFFFSGSGYRGREVFLRGIDQVKMRKVIQIQNDKNSFSTHKSFSPSMSGYYESLASSVMTFSNGFDTLFESHLTSRFSESILTKTLCFYENCDDLEIFFPDHFRFISVRNRHEFRAKLEGILTEPREAERFVDSIRETYLKNYGSRIVLDRIFHKG